MEVLKIIHNNIEQIMSQDAVTQNQIEVLNTPFMVDDIFTGKIKYVKKKKSIKVLQMSLKKKKNSAKQSDTTVMPDLESEESAAEIKNQ